MWLITGATGHVGSELIRQLAPSNTPLRALTRRPSALQLPPGVEVAGGDFEDEASLDAALRGVERVFLMSAQAIGSAPAPTHELAMLNACRRAGVRRIVKLSVLEGGGDDAHSPIVRWIGEAEAALKSSVAEWTLLRPGRFMSNALAWAPMLQRGNDVFVPFATRPAASIDPADVAALAALALRDDEHCGRAYELSGPECLTPLQEVEELSRVLGRPLRVVPLPLSAARDGMLRHGMPEAVVDAILEQTGSDRGTAVLPTIPELLGRPARTFSEWAHAHRGAFA
ncbi:MAG TPA: NAD(P)H-binding protein [Polyangiales bacterium]|nr:NAD(P)H-binding protein [Polyangiales bacterium]